MAAKNNLKNNIEKKIEAFRYAKGIYKSESGYRAMNNFLSRTIHSGQLRYTQADMMENPLSNTHEKISIQKLIDDLRWGMKLENRKRTKEETYDTSPKKFFYRGATCDGMRSYRLETFLSITHTIAQAESYENGCIFKIKLDPNIDHTSYGKNEDEILLIDGCYWEYKGIDPSSGYPLVYVHSRSVWERMPENRRPPWKGDPVKRDIANAKSVANPATSAVVEEEKIPSSGAVAMNRPITKEELEELRKKMMEETINLNADGGRRSHKKHKTQRRNRRKLSKTRSWKR